MQLTIQPFTQVEEACKQFLEAWPKIENKNEHGQDLVFSYVNTIVKKGYQAIRIQRTQLQHYHHSPIGLSKVKSMLEAAKKLQSGSLFKCHNVLEQFGYAIFKNCEVPVNYQDFEATFQEFCKLLERETPFSYLDENVLFQIFSHLSYDDLKRARSTGPLFNQAIVHLTSRAKQLCQQAQEIFSKDTALSAALKQLEQSPFQVGEFEEKFTTLVGQAFRRGPLGQYGPSLPSRTVVFLSLGQNATSLFHKRIIKKLLKEQLQRAAGEIQLSPSNPTKISDVVLTCLSEAVVESPLNNITVKLENLEIDDRQCVELIRALPLNKIKSISLKNNKIGNEGALYLASRLKELTRCFYIDLSDNNQDADAIKTLQREHQQYASTLHSNLSIVF